MRTSLRAFLAAVAVPAVVLATAQVTQADAGRHVGERATFAEPADWTGDGQHRNLGTPPPGTATLTPALEDGYLLLVGDRGVRVPA